MLAALAQSADGEVTALPVLLFYLAIPAFSIVAVGVACWVFWRAKRRDDQRIEDEAGLREREQKELTWRNARSS